MTFDGDPAEYYDHGVAVAGHNKPPAGRQFTAEEILGLIENSIDDTSLSGLEKLADVVGFVKMTRAGRLVQSISEFCKAMSIKRRDTAVKYRDGLLKRRFTEAGHGKRGVTVYQCEVPERTMLSILDAYNHNKLVTEGDQSNLKPVTRGDQLPVTEGDQKSPAVTPPVTEGDQLPVTSGDQSSRTRVSYTGRDIKNISPLRAHEDWIEFRPGPGKSAVISDKGREGWRSRGLDDDQIDLLLIESPPKLNAGDWLTDESFNAKMQMFFAKACRDMKCQDKRYLKGRELNKKEVEKQRRRPAGSKEALELLRKQKERGER